MDNIEPGISVANDIGGIEAEKVPNGLADIRKRGLAIGIDAKLIDHARDIGRDVPQAGFARLELASPQER